MKKKSVAIIVDDHELFSDSFASLIEKLNVFEEVKCFKDDGALFQFLMQQEYKTVFLFLDYFLENKVSINLIKDVKRISKKIKIVLVSSLMNPSIINKLLEQGPNGFISKASGFDILMKCLKAISMKKQYLCPKITELMEAAALTEKVQFTNKETELLHLFNQGFSIEKTAEHTNLSKHTIVAHRRNMMKKTNCNSIQELLWHSKELGIL